MEAAKIRCDIVHAVSKVGFRFDTWLTIGAMLAGGLGVKLGCSSSGDLTSQGRTRDPAKVTTENMIRDMLPTRPMFPSMSLEFLISGGASNRR